MWLGNHKQMYPRVFFKKRKNIVIIDLETQAQILINRFNKMEIFDR